MKSKKINSIEAYKIIFMYASLIYLGGATVLTRYKMTSLNADFGGILAVALVLILGVLCRVGFKSKNLFIILGLLSVWTILQSIKWQQILFPASLFWDVIAGYIICKAYRGSIFRYYEKCMYALCVIALILWLTSMIIPYFPVFLKIMSPNWIHGLIESNILIFGLQSPGWDAALFFRRNVGFAWEPGRFACFIIIAIFINLALNKFKIRNNYHLLIFLLTLLSTQSTTGYAVLIVILLIYYYNVRRRYFFRVALFAIPAIVFLFSLPFMTNKMNYLMIGKEHNEEFEKSAHYKVSQGRTFVPQRFDGLLWETYNFIHEPLLGYGKDTVRSFTGKTFNNQVVLYNGTIQIFAMFGIFWGLMIYYLYFRGSVYFSKIFRLKGSLAFFIIFFLINVSYPFHTEPIFIAMFWQPFYVDPEWKLPILRRKLMVLLEKRKINVIHNIKT